MAAGSAAAVPVPPDYEAIAEIGGLEEWVSEAKAASKDGEEGMYAG